MNEPTISPFQKLREIVARLRSPAGCPWDREQTNASLSAAVIEEAYEVAAAIRAKDDANLREELGDLLLVALMHAQIAEEDGRFDIDDSLQDACTKLIRRHPHVFAESDARDSHAVLQQWDAIKREEKGNLAAQYLADIPAAFPALMRAQKVQSKVARVNFDWSEIAPVVAKVEEEVAEVKSALSANDPDAVAEEIGDLLFAVTNLARKSKFDAETLLQSATDKFITRFHQLEACARAEGKKLGELDLVELDAIWNAIKAEPPMHEEEVLI